MPHAVAVLSQDILTVPAHALPATRSLLTSVDGEIVFEDRAPAATAPSKQTDAGTNPAEQPNIADHALRWAGNDAAGVGMLRVDEHVAQAARGAIRRTRDGITTVRLNA